MYKILYVTCFYINIVKQVVKRRLHIGRKISYNILNLFIRIVSMDINFFGGLPVYVLMKSNLKKF